MLEIKDLWVGVNGKEILKGVNLTIKEGETHVLMGPNGSGKSCLVMTIMGIPIYRIVKGKIMFQGKDISDLPIYQRAELGIGLAFQNPPEVRGVRLERLIQLIGNEEVDRILEKAFLKREFGNRDINLGFSGGEKKRSELAQLFALEPKLLLLDEIDSGVDIESLELLGKEVNSFLSGRSALIITHLGYILRYIKANEAHVLLDGKIARSGDPVEILNQIEEKGFGGVNE